MANPKIDFLYLSENDMIEAGVTDMLGCVDAMEEMFRLLKMGDFRMGGAGNNSHGIMMVFPEESPFPQYAGRRSRSQIYGYACVSRRPVRYGGHEVVRFQFPKQAKRTAAFHLDVDFE